MKKRIISKGMKIFLSILLILSIVFYTSGCIVLNLSGYKFFEYATDINFHELNFYINNSGFNCLNCKIDDKITVLNIVFDSQDVNITEYDGSDINIEFKDKISIKNKIVSIETNNILTLKPSHGIRKNAIINISIPKGFLENNTLTVNTINGNISAKNLNCKSLNVFSANGDMKISTTSSKYLKAETANGDIDLKNMHITNESKIISMSGDIHSMGNFAELYASTKSGDMDFTIFDSLNNTSLNCISGDISLDFPKASDYKINYNTKSGDINISDDIHANKDSKYSIDLKTVSGDISADVH